MAVELTTAASGRVRTLLGFSAFGAFWGGWGAALPAVQAHAGASDGALRLALLCIGAGALVSLRPAGALGDRHGPPALPVALGVFAACALLPALATSPLSLAVALLVVGAASGVVDVAINAEGVRSEAATDRPLMNLGHASFSLTVVVASLLVGALRAAGADVLLVFAVLAALVLAAGFVVPHLPAAEARADRADPAGGGLRALLDIPGWLAVLGGLTALAYFVENAWQSWSAVHLEQTLGAAPALAAAGPALFAATAATGRFAGQGLVRRVEDRRLVTGGAVLA